MKSNLVLFALIAILATACGPQGEAAKQIQPMAHTNYYVEITCRNSVEVSQDVFYSLNEPVCDFSGGGFKCVLPGPAFKAAVLGVDLVKNQKLASTAGYCFFSQSDLPRDWSSERTGDGTSIADQQLIDKFLEIANK